MNKALSRIKSIENYKWVMAIALLAALIHFMDGLVYCYFTDQLSLRSRMDGGCLFNSSLSYLHGTKPLYPTISGLHSNDLSTAVFLSVRGSCKITGISFLPLRLVSFASTLGCLIVIYCAVKDKTKSAIDRPGGGRLICRNFQVGGRLVRHRPGGYAFHFPLSGRYLFSWKTNDPKLNHCRDIVRPRLP